MKWIGQSIVDYIARFRSDVYLDSLTTTTDTSVLVVDSNDKICKNTTTLGGDLTGINVGAGLAGTDLTGPVPTLSVDFSDYGIIAPADGDSLATLASDTTTEQLTTLSALATLFAGTGLTAASSVITVDASQPNIDSIGTDGDTLNILADQLHMSNATADMPVIKLLNTTDDDQASRLIFEKLRDDDAVAQGQNLGEIWFRGQDSAQNTEDYAYILAKIDVSTHGQESGVLYLGLANHDGGNGVGLMLTGGNEDSEIDVTVGLGANSVVTVPGDIDLAGDIDVAGDIDLAGNIDVDGTLEADALTIGGARPYANSIISFVGQATMESSGNWVMPGKSGISNHTWNLDSGVNTEVNDNTAASIDRRWAHNGVRVPFACIIDGISCMISNAGGNRQVTVGLFCGRTDGSTLPTWGTDTGNISAEPILQIHADANNDGGSYSGRPSHAEVTGSDIAMVAGDVFYPAIKLTGVTSGGNTDNVYASFSVHIKTPLT